MKDSEAYKILQKLVLNASGIYTEDRIDIMRLLFEQEDLALYREAHEKREEIVNESV